MQTAINSRGNPFNLHGNVPMFVLVLVLALAGAARAADKPPIHIWFEPEWFEGVKGSFAYWVGPAGMLATTNNAWGVAGPGVSPEWTQGGESEWNSMGAAAHETKGECHRDFTVPRAGKYRMWVRFVDHRGKKEPFTATVSQGGKSAITGELGVKPVVPPNDEFALYWGFSFGWGSIEGNLDAGPAKLSLSIDKAGDAGGWRQVDAVLITDDLNYTPYAREKPPFGYVPAMKLTPKDPSAFRGSAKEIRVGESWKRPKLADRDFTMWTSFHTDYAWFEKQKDPGAASLYDALFNIATPTDIREPFLKQFQGHKDVPILSWRNLVPGFYLATPDLSTGTPLRQWLEKSKSPFFILTNYADPAYNSTNGPATYAALSGPLAGQFLGYIHGEAIGSVKVTLPEKPIGKTRRDHVDGLGKHVVKSQAEAWSEIYKTKVPESFRSKSIACLSCESITLAHQLHEDGCDVVGYEEDSTNVHVPMRIAFERGAARQYDGGWLNYASGNFGDACNYFTQNPIVNRGAGSWFHSKYAVTDGVTMTWYRKMYYLNYLSGSGAIFWEQGLGNQWILPGPGTHPIQLSPFGRATQDFQAFVDRLPDRGEPYTPIAFLLSYGHGYEQLIYTCKMLNLFTMNQDDVELRELFNVAWHPTGVIEGLPQAPDIQSLPSGVYGNIFDVLVDRPSKTKAILDYPVVWAAGDVNLGGPWQTAVEDYVKKGGTLVVNIEAVKRGIPASLTGLKPTGKTVTAEEWTPEGGGALACTPYDVAEVELTGAKPLASANPKAPIITRHAVGQGAVITTLIPRMIGQDERAHPSLPWLMNGVTAGLMPVEVRSATGDRLNGEVMYQLNRTKDGWLVMVMNNQGVDKTQNGVARVDRSKFADVIVRTTQPVKSAKEYTGPSDLKVEKKGDASEIRVRIPAGDVLVVGLVTK